MNTSTGYEPLIINRPSNGGDASSSKKKVPSTDADLSDVMILEAENKTIVRREVPNAKSVGASSRRTPSVAAYARVAPPSVPGLIQKQTASTPSTSGAGIRKQSPNQDIGAIDPAKIRRMRRETVGGRTIHVTGPEDLNRREGLTS